MKYGAIGVTGALALILTACGGNGGGTADSGDLADAAADVVKPQPGQYETNAELVSFEIPGMPENEAQMVRGMMGSAFTQVTSYCLTPEAAEKGFEEAVRAMRENQPDDQCEYTKFEVNGDAITSEMKCADDNGNSGMITVNGTVSETEQDLTMTLDQSSPDFPEGKMKMQVKTVAKRVGECAE